MWGVDLARHLSAQLEWLAGQFISRSPYENDRQTILRLVTAAEPEGLTLSALARKAGHIKAKERNAILEDLRMAGMIVAEAKPTAGRRAMVYRASQGGSALPEE